MKRLWQFPWGYPESALFAVGLVATGFLLQYVVGYFDFGILHAPVNVVVLAAMLALIALGGIFFPNALLIRWLAGVPMAISLVVALLLFGLAMTFSPQLPKPDPEAVDLVSRLGFAKVTAAWPFVLLYGATLLSLGLTIALRLRRFTLKDTVFLCNHLGLWIWLAVAGLGAADMVRVVLYVNVGETEWRVFNRNNDAIELPLAVQLNKFILEVYPPRLTVIDRESGHPQPEGEPDYYQIDPRHPDGQLGEWQVTLEEYLHEAVKVGGVYRASPMPASVPAARVVVRNSRTGEVARGWVSSGGSVAEFFSSLNLDKKYALVMTVVEPKRYASEITVLTRDGKRQDAVLEVNHPLVVGDWRIYQYSYDTAAGRMSTYSALELVYDPWLLYAKIGMAIMTLGALGLIWKHVCKRRDNRGRL